tara:strand:+ start:1701 stop:1934 length:234 start_codon:yes stop_codon:yes gene_type:complete
MKLFRSKEKFELFTQSQWETQNESEEVVLSGTKSEITEYAKKAGFVWHEDESYSIGGYYTKSIDGYRKRIYQVRKRT